MEEIKTMINKIGKNITNTSKTIIKNTKLSIKLSSQEEKLKNLYIETGKKVYEIYSYGGNIGDFFKEKYYQMLEVEKEILDIKRKIEDNKNEYENLNQTIHSEKTEDIEGAINNNSMIRECIRCNSCGQINNLNDKFCLKCGRVL